MRPEPTARAAPDEAKSRKGAPRRGAAGVHFLQFTRRQRTAYLGHLPSEGAALAHVCAPTNQMWKVTMGPAQAVFEFCFPEAGERTRLGLGVVAEVGDGGRPAARSGSSAALASSPR